MKKEEHGNQVGARGNRDRHAGPDASFTGQLHAPEIGLRGGIADPGLLSRFPGSPWNSLAPAGPRPDDRLLPRLPHARLVAAHHSAFQRIRVLRGHPDLADIPLPRFAETLERGSQGRAQVSSAGNRLQNLIKKPELLVRPLSLKSRRARCSCLPRRLAGTPGTVRPGTRGRSHARGLHLTPSCSSSILESASENGFHGLAPFGHIHSYQQALDSPRADSNDVAGPLNGGLRAAPLQTVMPPFPPTPSSPPHPRNRCAYPRNAGRRKV